MNGSFFCNKCGAQNLAGAQYCSRCGTATGSAPVVDPMAATASSPALPSPYAAPSYQPVAPVTPVAYGGFWIRVVAAIIDTVLVRIVVTPIGLVFGGLGLAGGTFLPGHVPLAIMGGGVTFIVALFASWLYEAFMESSSYQGTLGKMIFGLKVVDLNGNRISFQRATGRHFAKWLSAMILLIGYIMVGLTERKQGLHDLIAETLVRKA